MSRKRVAAVRLALLFLTVALLLLVTLRTGPQSDTESGDPVVVGTNDGGEPGGTEGRKRVGSGEGEGQLPPPGPSHSGSEEDDAAGEAEPEEGAASGDDPSPGDDEAEAEQDGDEASTEQAAEPPPPKSPPPEIAGRVVDAATGEPVQGARVHYAMIHVDGTRVGSYNGTTDAEGRYDIDGWKDRPLEKMRAELLVRAKGYRSWLAPVTGPLPEARLTPDDGVKYPATLEGVITGPVGHPYSGLVAIDAYDEDGNYRFHQWTWAAEDGSYSLPGVPPGRWRIGVVDGANRPTVEVPEGTIVWLALDTTAAQLAGRDGLSSVETREVLVTGLANGATVRAERRARHFFRAVVRGGTARFPALPIGRWRFIDGAAGGDAKGVSLAVTLGDEPLVIAYPE